MNRLTHKSAALLITAAAIAFPDPASAQVAAGAEFYYTGPYGAGGTWNLYQVVPQAMMWDAANTAATGRLAGATGVAGVPAGQLTLPGHLVQISSHDENSFVAGIATIAPMSGNSNVWLGATDQSAEQVGNHSGWEWAGATDTLDPTEFAAWAPGEPNNAGAGEHYAELRTDGNWNDLPLAGQNRRFVIEWEINAAGPIAGASVFPLYFSRVSGAAGKFNLYKVSYTSCLPASTAGGTSAASQVQVSTWVAAHTYAGTVTADSSGLSPVAGNMTLGHLAAITSEEENYYLYRAMSFGAFNGQSTWIGLTDSPTYGGTEAFYDPNGGWKWAGTSETFAYQRFVPRPPIGNVHGGGTQPDNAASLEHAVEMTGAGYWNDAQGANPAIFRRYIIEWEIQADTVLTDPGIFTTFAPLVSGTRVLTNVGSLTQWALREQRNMNFGYGRVGVGNVVSALFYANNPRVPDVPAAGDNQVNEATPPILNHGDVSTAAAFGGRSLAGVYLPDLAFPGDQAATDDSNIVITGQTQIAVTTGQNYTVNVHGDDGFILKITGPGTATFSRVSGLGFIDRADTSAIFVPYGTGDSNTRGVFSVSADGTYNVEYVGWEGGGGAAYEVTWATGDFSNDADSVWTLMGGPVPAGTPLFPQPAGSLNVPAPAGSQWSVRTVFGAGTLAVSEPAAAIAVLQGAAGTRTDVTAPVINYVDASNINRRGLFVLDNPIPGENTGANDDNYIIAGKLNWNVPTAGVYTVVLRGDDLAAIRIKDVRWRGRTGTSAIVNGVVDTYDNSTLFHPVGGGDSNTRGVVELSAGVAEVELFHYESTGGSNIEVYAAPGIHIGDIDTNLWKLLGDTSALTPALPATIGGPPMGGDGTWGLHVVSQLGGPQLTTFASAIAALESPGTGVHTYAQSAVLNHIEPDHAGPAGIYSADQILPGEQPGVNDDDLAVHATGRIAIATAGYYTINVRASDAFALRIKGTRWHSTFSGAGNSTTSAGIDPADPSTMITANVGGGGPSEVHSRGFVWLNPGCYDLDFITFERGGDFHFEVSALKAPITGNFLTFGAQGEYINIVAGLAAPLLEWKLIGHQAVAGGINTLGISSAGWSIDQTTPFLGATAPTGWASTIPGAEAWLAAPGGGANTLNFIRDYANFQDAGFGGPGSITNDVNFPRNTQTGAGANQDDNFYATRFTATLEVPVTGTYQLGWQGDDGGYFEFALGGALPVGSAGFTRLCSDATPILGFGGGNIVASSDGTPNGRIEFNAGGGNTRTIGEIMLPAGSYPIRGLWFEGSGGSYWEFLTGSGDAFPVGLLFRDGDFTGVADTSGLPLVSQLFAFISQSLAGNNFTMTWNSAPGLVYDVEWSTDLVIWTIAPGGNDVASGGFTTTLTVALPDGHQRYSFRVRK